MKYFMDLMINSSYIIRCEVDLEEEDLHMSLSEFESTLSKKATELTGTDHKIKVLLLLQKKDNEK